MLDRTHWHAREIQALVDEDKETSTALPFFRAAFLGAVFLVAAILVVAFVTTPMG